MQRNVEIVTHGQYEAMRNLLLERCTKLYTELRGLPFRNSIGLVWTLALFYIP